MAEGPRPSRPAEEERGLRQGLDRVHRPLRPPLLPRRRVARDHRRQPRRHQRAAGCNGGGELERAAQGCEGGARAVVMHCAAYPPSAAAAPAAPRWPAGRPAARAPRGRRRRRRRPPPRARAAARHTRPAGAPAAQQRPRGRMRHHGSKVSRSFDSKPTVILSIRRCQYLPYFHMLAITQSIPLQTLVSNNSGPPRSPPPRVGGERRAPRAAGCRPG
jgi:hypothetical protein